MMLHKRNVPEVTKVAEPKKTNGGRAASLANLTNAGKGRPKGVTSKRIQRLKQIADQAALNGITPLEIMLNTARHLYHGAMNATRVWKGKTLKYVDEDKLQAAASIAKDAAPYVHPRLSTVEVVRNMSDDDLDTIIAGAAAQAGLVIDMTATSKTIEPQQLQEKSGEQLKDEAVGALVPLEPDDKLPRVNASEAMSKGDVPL